MDNLDDILLELEQKYPKWLIKGLAGSPEIKSIEASLAKLSGLTSTNNKNFNKASKDMKQNFSDLGKGLTDFDKVIGKTSDSFDDILKSTEDLAKAQENLRKKLIGNIGTTLKSSAKELFKGRVGSAVDEFSGGLMGAAKTLKGFGGVALAAVGLLSEGISRTAELLYKNNAAYIKLSQSGVTLSDSLTGMTQGAIAANLSLEDFTQLAVQNSSVLAQMGTEGAKDLGRFTKNIRLGTNIMGRFGFDVEEVSDYLTDYLAQQKILGFLNLRTQRDLNAGFQQFITDSAEFSNILGYSRKEIMKSVTQVTSTPQWGFFIKSLGDAGVNVNNAFTKASETISSIAGPELGGKLTELLRDYVTVGGPANDQTREMATYLAANNSQLLQQIQSYATNIKQGKQAAATTKDMYKQLYSAASNFNNQSAAAIAYAGLYPELSKEFNDLSGTVKNNNDYLEKNNMTLDEQLALKEKERAQSEEVRQAMANLHEVGTALGNTWDAMKSAIIVGVEPALVKLGKALNSTMRFLLDFSQFLGDVASGKIFSFSYWKNKVMGTTAPAVDRGITSSSSAILGSTATAPSATRSMGVGTGVAPRAGTGGTGGARSQDVINYLMQKGWSREQATGIAANLYAESKFDPSAPGDGGKAYGIAQWHPDRQAQFRAFKGRDIRGSSLEDQLDFVDYELRNGNERAAGSALMGASTSGQAASIVSRKYERPADVWGQANARSQIATTFASAAPTTSTPAAPVTTPTATTSGISGDAIVSLLSAQVKQLQDAVDKLTVIAVNTGDHTDKLRKLTNEVKNNSSSM